MAGLFDNLQNPIGCALEALHRVGGFQVDYTLVSDTSTNPLTSITFSGIYVWPTALVKERQHVGGRNLDGPLGGGLFAAEQQPEFIISREALKSGGVYYTPTTFDTFVETGTTSPKFQVMVIAELAPKTPGWSIRYETIFRQGAGR